MFNPLPYQEINALYSADNILESHVRAAISEAKLKNDEAKGCINKLLQEASEEEINHGWVEHASRAAREAADLARIHAVLLTAIHIEGAVNAFGVYVTGEDFFKSHIERCSLESKLALTIALLGKGCIQKKHPAFLAFRDLFERRNQIAHRKTKEWHPDSSDHIRVTKSNSDLDACSKAMDTFRELLLEVDQNAAFMAGVHKEEETL